MASPTYAAVLKNKGFRSLWLNQFLLQLAGNTLNFALIIWVYKLTDSNFAVSALVAAIYLPALIFGIFAGVFADIVDKRKIIIAVDLLFALSLGLFVLIKDYYLLILLNAFFINSLAQFFMPAESSSIPVLVSKKQIFLANSLFSLTLYASFLIGFSLAGPVMERLGINSVFILGVLLYFGGFLLAQSLPVLKNKHFSKHSKKFLTNLYKLKKSFDLSIVRGVIHLTVSETKETLSYVRGKLNVTVAIGLLASMQGIIGMLAVLMPSYMERVLRIHATNASYFLMIPLGLGTMVGALLLGKFAHGIPKRLIVVPAIIASGFLFFAVGATPAIAQYIRSAELPISTPKVVSKLKLRYYHTVPSVSTFFALGAFLIGLCAVSVIIPSQTVIQENIEDKVRGKIVSVLIVLMNTFSAIPVLLSGLLSDYFGVSAIFIWIGVLTFVLGIFTMRPAYFLKEAHLPYKMREFLGLGHWEKSLRLAEDQFKKK